MATKRQNWLFSRKDLILLYNKIMQEDNPKNHNQNIEEILELSKKNNIFLEKIYKYQRIQIFFKTIYWIVVIVGIVLAYRFLSPFYSSFLDNYHEVKDNLGSILNTNQTFLDSIKSIFSTH